MTPPAPLVTQTKLSMVSAALILCGEKPMNSLTDPRYGAAVGGGWIGYLIAGFIGACLLIWIVRALRGRTA